MANVVRLTNGGTIQVRTGVLQGIGPQGERGYTGPQGQQGEQGQTGETGPMGAILQMAARVNVATNNPIAANTDTLMAFGSVSYDDLSCATSSSNFTLNLGDHLLSLWLRFDDAAVGSREVWFSVAGTTLARASRASVAGMPFYVDLAFPYRAAAGDVVSVFARSSVATAVSMGSMNVTRVGSGPPGAQGPVGPQGAVGATGAAGPAGPPGTANSGFVKYGDMLPH